MSGMGALADAEAGLISPEVATARLLLAGQTPAAILAGLPETAVGRAVAALVRARQPALQALAAEVAATVAGHDASGPEGPARIAAFFDRAVRHSPEASVALYSLGDPAILAAATAEITGWLAARGLVSPAADVLDLGCGIGRIAGALAPGCRSVLGLDVSAAMVAEAASRLAPFRNVAVRQTAGHDIDDLPPASFDLVLAIDSFPYIVQSGLAAGHVAGAARALRPGGALCILNLSYRADPALDAADAARWAAESGLTLVLANARPFGLWDGTAFILRA